MASTGSTVVPLALLLLNLLCLQQSLKSPTYNLSLDFETGFSDWNAHQWKRFYYASTVATSMNVSAMNQSSTCGATTVYMRNIIFRYRWSSNTNLFLSTTLPRTALSYKYAHCVIHTIQYYDCACARLFFSGYCRRPRLIHPLDLAPNSTLEIRFSLKVVGSFFALGMLIEQLNPGFKLYVGDVLLFDYGVSGKDSEVSYSILIKLLSAKCTYVKVTKEYKELMICKEQKTMQTASM